MIILDSVTKEYSLGLSKYSLFHRLFRKKIPFNKILALSNITFDIPQGEVLGIIGRNGAGKSTLLQIICGTLSPTSGVLKVNGKVGALLELGSGFHPEFTGIENIYLSASVMGLSKAEIEIKLDDIIEFADIGQFINLPTKTYSTGMLMRLAFAVATTSYTDVLVIDEALSVGDQEFSQKSFNRILELRDTGTTIIFCSHSTYQVESLCNQVVWLDKGSIVKNGPAKEVITAYLQSQDEYTYTNISPSTIPYQTDQNTFIEKIEFFKNGLILVEPVILKSRVDELKVKVCFTAHKSQPTLAITIRRHSGEIIGSAGSKNDSRIYNLDGNKKYFEIKFPKIVLLKGDYYVDISLFCEHGIITYDYASRILDFQVVQDDLEQGLVHLSHEWC